MTSITRMQYPDFSWRVVGGSPKVETCWRQRKVVVTLQVNNVPSGKQLGPAHAILTTKATATRPVRILGYESRRMVSNGDDQFEAEFVVPKTIGITKGGGMVGECNITEQVPIDAESLAIVDVSVSDPLLSFFCEG